MKTSKRIVVVLAVLLLMVVGLFCIKMLMIEKGVTAVEDGRYEEAVKYIEPLSKLGDSNAQYLFGLLHVNGWGVEKDRDEAIRWFRMAAMWHDGDYDEAAPAAYYLGREQFEEYDEQYWQSEINKQELTEAVFWIEWSADHGYPHAAEMVAYLKNKGIIENK